jgi:hypothetical protein
MRPKPRAGTWGPFLPSLRVGSWGGILLRLTDCSCVSESGCERWS